MMVGVDISLNLTVIQTDYGLDDGGTVLERAIEVRVPVPVPQICRSPR